MNIRIKLLEGDIRPVFRLPVGGRSLTVLFDTGAQVPVFIGTQERLEEMGGRLEMPDVAFVRFGGSCPGNSYRLDLDMAGFIFYDLLVMQTTHIMMPLDFIFSAGMFSRFSYTIDNRQKIMNINTYEMRDMTRMTLTDDSGRPVILIDDAALPHDGE